jgi:hypothetical protein
MKTGRFTDGCHVSTCLQFIVPYMAPFRSAPPDRYLLSFVISADLYVSVLGRISGGWPLRNTVDIAHRRSRIAEMNKAIALEIYGTALAAVCICLAVWIVRRKQRLVLTGARP